MSKIVYGHHGCGKTRNADLIATHLGLDNIVDDYTLGSPLPYSTLALTNDPDALEISGIVEFDDVMAEIAAA